METDFIFLGTEITVDGDCSHKVKRRLLLGRKAMTDLDSILKTRDITLLTKVCIVKAVVFSSHHGWMEVAFIVILSEWNSTGHKMLSSTLFRVKGQQNETPK